MTNSSGFSLDDINLPVEDANKPTDSLALNDEQPPADTKPDSEPPKPEEDPNNPPADDSQTKPVQEDNPEDKKGDEQEKPLKNSDNKEKETKPEDNQPPADTKPDDEKPAPFHEHPDWKKMQDRLKAAEEQARIANEELKKTKEAADPFTGMTPEQVAEAKVRQEIKDGKLEAKDELVINRRYSELLRQETETRTAEAERQNTEGRKEAERQIQEKYNELGITDANEQKLINDQVLQWAEKGISVNLSTFEIAAENLKLQGKIKGSTGEQKPNESPKPAPSAESLAKEKQQADQRKKANDKISQGKSSGDTSGAKKPTAEYLRGNTLDDIVSTLTHNIQ